MDFLNYLSSKLKASELDDINKKQVQIDVLNEENKQLRSENDQLSKNYKDLIMQLIQLNKEKEALIDTKTPLEKYCDKNLIKKDKFAYKYKLYVKDKSVPVYPNEMITPDAYVIVQARKEIGPKETFQNYRFYLEAVGNWVDKHIKWTSDKVNWGKDDEYSYPNQTITLGAEDCENHALVLASIDPDIGVAYGFCGDPCHSFGVVVIDSELYVIETNSVIDVNDNYKLIKYDGQTLYKIGAIFTKNYTYEMPGNTTKFGILA